jgi:hypothetical protein
MNIVQATTTTAIRNAHIQAQMNTIEKAIQIKYDLALHLIKKQAQVPQINNNNIPWLSNLINVKA